MTQVTNTTADASATPADQSTNNANPGAQVSGQDGQGANNNGAAGEPAKPVEIKLTMPEGTLLDSKRVDEVLALAKEKGLDQAAAQGLIDTEHAALTKYHEAQLGNHKNLIEKEWPNQLKADKEFGGEKFVETVEYAKRGLEWLGVPDLNKALDESGYGNFPPLLKALSILGRKINGGQTVLGNSSVTEEKSAADLFYGESK